MNLQGQQLGANLLKFGQTNNLSRRIPEVNRTYNYSLEDGDQEIVATFKTPGGKKRRLDLEKKIRKCFYKRARRVHFEDELGHDHRELACADSTAEVIEVLNEAANVNPWREDYERRYAVLPERIEGKVDSAICTFCLAMDRSGPEGRQNRDVFVCTQPYRPDNIRAHHARVHKTEWSKDEELLTKTDDESKNELKNYFQNLERTIERARLREPPVQPTSKIPPPYLLQARDREQQAREGRLDQKAHELRRMQVVFGHSNHFKVICSLIEKIDKRGAELTSREQSLHQREQEVLQREETLNRLHQQELMKLRQREYVVDHRELEVRRREEALRLEAEEVMLRRRRYVNQH